MMREVLGNLHAVVEEMVGDLQNGGAEGDFAVAVAAARDHCFAVVLDSIHSQ